MAPRGRRQTPYYPDEETKTTNDVPPHIPTSSEMKTKSTRMMMMTMIIIVIMLTGVALAWYGYWQNDDLFAYIGMALMIVSLCFVAASSLQRLTPIMIAILTLTVAVGCATIAAIRAKQIELWLAGTCFHSLVNLSAIVFSIRYMYFD